MRNDGLHAELEHRIAELRARYPRIESCRAALAAAFELAARRAERRHA